MKKKPKTNTLGKCDCEHCKESQMISACSLLLPEPYATQLEIFYDKHISIDVDLSYYQSILDGSWPQAEVLLKAALKRVRAQKRSEQ